MNTYRLDLHPSHEDPFPIESDRWSDDGGPMRTPAAPPPSIEGQLELADDEWIDALLAGAAAAECERYCHPWEYR